MLHDTPLIATVVTGLGLAFVFGTLAQRFGISPLVGYLLAGVAVGPFTPGFVADQSLATQLAELGVILLMFGVGLHFSLHDLLSVRSIALPGAVVQIAVATVMGLGLSSLLGWSIGAGLVFGLALSVASTVVLLRAMQERRLMLVVGRRLIPKILHYVAHTGSRELFRLAVLSIALCIAFGAARLFDVSLALGAFFAGMMLSESPLSQRAAQESLPLRDAFAVLFFVSVGMLFDPSSIIRAPWPLIATLAIIIVGKSAAAFLIVRAFGHPLATALTISASLAQIGEFSFILAELGVTLDLLPKKGRDLILAGAILSIMLNPLIFSFTVGLAHRLEAGSLAAGNERTPEPISSTSLTDHAIIVGYGRVGSIVGETLRQRKRPFLVIETSDSILPKLRASSVETIAGNAARPDVLNAANPAAARYLAVAIPEAFEAGQIVQQARTANPSIQIVARAHSDAEVAHLTALGADAVIMGEREIALGMLEALEGRLSHAADEDRSRITRRMS